MRETSGAGSTDASVGPSSSSPCADAPRAAATGEAEPSRRVLARVDDVAVTRSGELRIVVLALARGDAKPFAIEGTGVVIWDELDGIRSLAEIARDLAEEFGVDAAVIEPDLVSFALELEARGLAVRR